MPGQRARTPKLPRALHRGLHGARGAADAQRVRAEDAQLPDAPGKKAFTLSKHVNTPKTLVRCRKTLLQGAQSVLNTLKTKVKCIEDRETN